MRDLLLSLYGNPVYRNEVRSFGRRHRYLFGPLFVLTIEALLTAAMMLSSLAGGHIALEDAATAYFWASLVLAEGLVVLLTPALAALSVSREHSRLTLDQVLVTPLLTREILWGKFAAVTTEVGLGAAPALAIAALAGLVSADVDNLGFLVGEGMVTVSFLVLALGCGMLQSIAFRRPATALGGTYAAVLGLFCAGWLLFLLLVRALPDSAIKVAWALAFVRGGLCLPIGLTCAWICFRRLGELRANA